MPATEGNILALRKWIVDRYKSSAFNICTHLPLPLVNSSPALRLYVDPKARPVAVHKAAQVPLHFMEEIKEGLDTDVRLGVIEKVPVNTPTEWCSRMVTVVKKNGKPRRTVDFKAVNASAPRQTHVVDPPFIQAASVPQTHGRQHSMHGMDTTPYL